MQPQNHLICAYILVFSVGPFQNIFISVIEENFNLISQLVGFGPYPHLTTLPPPTESTLNVKYLILTSVNKHCGVHRRDNAMGHTWPHIRQYTTGFQVV